MLKAMLVDDEKNIIEMMKRIVDWKALGYEICGESYDGRDAIERVDTIMPDVIFADINMPFVDGLKFAEIIRQKHPKIKIIMLTGYNDFNYARKAVNIGAYYYLLKPVDKTELEKVLLEAAMQIMLEAENEKGVLVLKAKAELSENIVREKFLNELINGKLLLTDEKIKEKLLEFKINFIGEKFRVIVVEIDRVDKLYSDAAKRSFIVNRIIETINSVFQGIGGYFTFSDTENKIMIVTCENTDVVRKHSNLMILCEKVKLELHELWEVPVTIGYGSDYEGYANISKSYSEALAALKYKFIMGSNRVINYNSIEFSNTIKDHCSEKTRNEIMSNLRIGNQNNLRTIVHAMFEQPRVQSTSLEHIQRVCIELILIGISFLNENDIKIPEVLGKEINPSEEIESKETLKEAQEWVVSFYIQSVEYILKNKISSSKRIVEKAIKYMDKNLQNADLSVGLISKELHLNEDYLSSLFKKELGMPLVKYITGFRLIKAKEMMDAGWCNLSDVAEKVGYEDQNYFGKCFKKYYGITPSKYIERK